MKQLLRIDELFFYLTTIFLHFIVWLSHHQKKPQRYRLVNDMVNGSSLRLEKFSILFLFNTMQKEMQLDFLTLLHLLLVNTRDEKFTLQIKQKKSKPFERNF